MVFCNIKNIEVQVVDYIGHNPYFNRWFSAIDCIAVYDVDALGSQSLF